MRLPLQLRTTLAMVLAALSWLAAAHAHAQDFPSRVIRVVVAFPSGGPTDFVARLLADKPKPLPGQNVIVENRPGANGAIGAEYVAKGEADGHLLFLTTIGAVAITPHLSKPNYDTLRDFAPDHAGGSPHHNNMPIHGHFLSFFTIPPQLPPQQSRREARRAHF